MSGFKFKITQYGSATLIKGTASFEINANACTRVTHFINIFFGPSPDQAGVLTPTP